MSRVRPMRPALLALLLCCAGCATLRTDVPRQQSQALPPQADTPSSRYIESELKKHAGLSGFRVLSKADNALLSRIVLADHARHSIDLQYYIFNNDATGRLLAQRLLTAADRGVRVRILVDDINAGKANTMLSALATHANIEVRMFNPFRTRSPSFFSKAAQLVLEARRLNRRMHNKSFVVDGWVAVLGGRNIGDEYFDAAKEASFRDLDVITIGPVVADTETSFDKYWNAEAAYPLIELRPSKPAASSVREERHDLAEDARQFAQSDYAQAVLEDMPEGPTADRRGEWFWGNAQFIADEPEKVDADKDKAALRMGPRLRQLFDASQRELVLISPYFVPSEKGVKYLTGLMQRGVAIKLLTNSLASTDELAVYAWYAHSRTPLLEQGMQFYELRPQASAPQAVSAGGTSAGVSLHAKAAVVDRRFVFVGSMNMDQRSKLLNTEVGVIVDCPPLADAVLAFFDAAAQPQTSYTVQLRRDGGRERVTWHAEDDGKRVDYDSEPEADAKKRLQVALLSVLPIEELL